MRKLGILAILFVTALSCGCSSQPKRRFNVDLSQRRVTIRTEPTAARVKQIGFVNKSPTDLGTTPLVDLPVMVITKGKFNNLPGNETERLLEQVNNVVVIIEKDGYEPYRAVLATTPNETIEHSITLTPK
ncbi:MAG: hypothetical protein ACYS8Z_03585 [Planctomycetota bacterium]|jgi:hypothetical protein